MDATTVYLNSRHDRLSVYPLSRCPECAAINYRSQTWYGANVPPGTHAYDMKCRTCGTLYDLPWTIPQGHEVCEDCTKRYAAVTVHPVAFVHDVVECVGSGFLGEGPGSTDRTTALGGAASGPAHRVVA